MTAFTAELRANGFTQLYFLAALVMIVIFGFTGQDAWGSLVTASVIIFGFLGGLRALFVPRELRLLAALAWVLGGVVFVPVLLYAWYAARPGVSMWSILTPPVAAAVGFIPSVLFAWMRRTK